jgi:hypothetical protein
VSSGSVEWTNVNSRPTALSQFTNDSGYITGVTNISGYANNLYSQDIRTIAPNTHGAYRLNFGFTSWNNNNTAPYADYIHLRSYSDGSGGSDNLITFLKSGIGMRIWQQSFASGTAYSSYVDVITSGNIGSQSVSSASTVTHFASRTDGTWYNIIWGAGNPSHLYSSDAVQIQSSTGAVRANIFYDNQDTTYYLDPNSTGTSFRGRGEIFLGPNSSGEYTRLGGNGGAVDHATLSASNGNLHIDCKQDFGLYLNYYSRNTIYLGNAGYAITDNGSYYNGTSAASNSVAWTNVSSRPTALSQFTNDLGNYGGWLTTGGKAADSELIDGIDSSRIVYGDGARASTGSGSMDDPNQKSGFHFAYNPTGRPYEEYWNWITIAGNSWQSSNNYSFQLAHDFHNDAFYVRRMTAGTAYSWREVITSGNISSQSVNYATSAGNADTVDGKHATNNANNLAVYESNGYLYIPNWLNVNSGGIFSSTNNAHIRPNTASYGAWEMIGSRNGWSGIYFSDSGDYLMANNNEVGHYQHGVGWKFRWYLGQMYVSRNNTGGGTEYTVLDSGNYSSWAIARGGDTVTGIINFQTNNGGRSGATDSAKLQAYSTGNNAAFMSFHKSGVFAINFGLDDDNVMRMGGWSASPDLFQMDMSGTLTMKGDVIAFSDARVKENIQTLDGALEKTLKLRGVSYNRIDIDDKSTKIGVIAQEILEVVPEVVSQDANGTYGVSYGNIVGLLIEAIKEQQQQINNQQQQIDDLLKNLGK